MAGHRNKIQCGIHGTKYFVFQRTGPCMHPDCAIARIEFWVKNSKKSEKVFRPVMGELYDFVVWGMTDGSRYVLYDWGNREAWEYAVDKYRDMKQLQRARRMATVETDKLVWLSNERQKTGFGHDTEKMVLPDGHLWVRECSQYLAELHNESMVAHLLGIIDLFDLSKLCYSGDIIETKHQVLQAKLDLKEWFFGRQSQHHPQNHQSARS